MASLPGNGIFHQILMEEYNKKESHGHEEVVTKKRQNFQTMLFKAHDELALKKFSDAKRAYMDIIELVENDPYPDEFDLHPDLLYCLKCCFCYSCLMDSHTTTVWDKRSSELVKDLSEKYDNRLFPKFLQVLHYFREGNWAKTLQWCNTIFLYTENADEHVLAMRLIDKDVANAAVLPMKVEIVAQAEIYETKSLLHYWEKMLTNRLQRANYLDVKEKERCQFLIQQALIIMNMMDIKTPYVMDNTQDKMVQQLFPFLSGPQDAVCNNAIEKINIVTHGDCIKDKWKAAPITEKTIRLDVKFEKLILKLVEAFSKAKNCNFIESGDMLSKIEEIGDIITQSVVIKDIENDAENLEKKRVEQMMAQTQTEKVKTGNRSMQTEALKTRNAEVQVNSDAQLITTLMDIKNKLLVHQEKKDDMITKLNRKVCELNEKLNKETNKKKSVEEEYQRRFIKQEVELKKLRGELVECSKLRDQEKEKNLFLQKLLVEQITEKFNAQKSVYKMFEKKSAFMIQYLKDISQFLTPNSVPSKLTAQQNIEIWENHLKKTVCDLEQLNVLYRKIRLDVLNSENFNVTWPEIPDFPRDDDNIIFVSFKPAIKNILDIEENLVKKYNTAGQASVQQFSQLPPSPLANPYALRPQLGPQFPMQGSSYFMGPRLIYPTMQPPIPVVTTNAACTNFTRPRIPYETAGYHHIPDQQNHLLSQDVWQNPNIQPSRSTENLRPTEKDLKLAETMKLVIPEVKARAAAINESNRKAEKKYQEKEKMIFEYVVESCPNSSEEDVTLALLDVVNDNKGTLAKLSKDKIVQEVKTVLRMKKQSAWVMPKSPHVDWEKDDTEQNCSICFEEFILKETYTLPCKHEYHKECIKKWLKTSSVCPICRVHSVIDEEFPPLY